MSAASFCVRGRRATPPFHRVEIPSRPSPAVLSTSEVTLLLVDDLVVGQ